MSCSRGGDGLALREILRHPSVEHVTLVDLDPGMTGLSKAFPPLEALNARAFHDARVRVVNADAFVWLDERPARAPAFNVIVVDFPDPNHFALGKLYTKGFYTLLRRALSDDGVAAVQSTSPLLVPKTFWTIVTTLEAAGWHAAPYQVHVPSFGAWGFNLIRLHPFTPPTHSPRVDGLRFVDDSALRAMFVLPKDLARQPTEVNRLDNQVLVRTYETEGARWR